MEPSIYKYLDYRQFLKDVLAYKRSMSQAFSLELLGRKTGCLTKSHISLIVSGKRTLTTRRADALGRALGLSDKEIGYYHKLVQFNQARDDIEKEHHLADMMSYLGRTSAANIPLKSYQVLEDWHCLAIRELARRPNFDANPQVIASRLKGYLTPADAKRALRTLTDAGMLKSTDDGAVKPTAETLRTTDEVNSLAVRKYHKSCLELAKRVIETEPIENREFGSVNILVRPEDKPKLKELIKNFREQVLALSQESVEENAQVTQVNVQMFQISN